ncbi:hypothetical protein N9A28_03875 [Sulfurimonas sp.]|nr:hypothetical protein [Sulfurimonas sp.]
MLKMMSKRADLYAYKTTFNLTSGASLDDFWSYVIFRLNVEKSEYTYDRFARVYNLLCDYKSDISKHPVSISLEESSHTYFISLNTSSTKLISEFMKRLTKLNYEYKYENNILNYSIEKKLHVNKLKKDIRKTYDYSFIDSDDISEMSDTLERMQEKNYEQLNIPLSINEVNEYRSTFSYYSSYLKYYSQLNTINNIVAELSVLLSLYPNECLAAGENFRVVVKSFLNSLEYWQEKLFIEGSQKIDFMDNSLKADLSQIKIILNLYDEIEDDSTCSIDDIFDF